MSRLDPTTTDALLLSALYDAGGALPYRDLLGCLSAPRRDVWRALSRQYSLGNLRRQLRREDPIALTSSARIAIQAGRLAQPERQAA